MRIAVLMPAYDEGARLGRALSDLATLQERAQVTVFVVDDGSSPPVDARAIRKDAPGIRVVVARHAVNLGQGAALETARRLALDPRLSEGHAFDAYVTMDADGQHGAEDVFALAGALQSGADVALGDRFAGRSIVPPSRRALLTLARIFERWTTGLALSDAHNGLRAFRRGALAQIRIRQNRMAHATELTRRIARAGRGLRAEGKPLVVVEVPVCVRYTPESLAKGQSAWASLTIVADLFRGFLFER